MEPEQIAARCDRVGLPRKRLAELAGVDETTVERTFNGKTSPYYETVRKLSEAVEAHEIAVLDHLADLHPQRAIERATAAMCPERRRPAA